jgi:hypothetical protein
MEKSKLKKPSAKPGLMRAGEVYKLKIIPELRSESDAQVGEPEIRPLS